MKLILTILSVIILTFDGIAEDWSFRIHPDSVRLISSSPMQKPAWYATRYGLKNFTNLSFFTGRGFIPPYKDSEVTILRNPLSWPYFCIGNRCYVGYGSPTADSRFIVSGYPALLKSGTALKIKRSFFTRRVCPRTAIGIDSTGYLIIFVTTGANLKTLQQKMMTLGCVDAINLDGGSSTFLYKEGRRLISSKQARTYPNVLAW